MSRFLVGDCDIDNAHLHGILMVSCAVGGRLGCAVVDDDDNDDGNAYLDDSAFFSLRGLKVALVVMSKGLDAHA